MNHQESMQTQAAERYLLGELPPAERQAFEAHYFQCSECAEEVRVGFEFRRGAVALFCEDGRACERPARRRRRWEWLSWIRPAMAAPVAACALLAVLGGYQNIVEIPSLRANIGRLETPQVLPSTPVLAPSSRASVPSIVVSSAAPFFPLSLAADTLLPAPQYQCELRSESGATIWKIAVPGEHPDGAINLLVPTPLVPSGHYVAVLLGKTGNVTAELEHYHFAIRRE